MSSKGLLLPPLKYSSETTVEGYFNGYLDDAVADFTGHVSKKIIDAHLDDSIADFSAITQSAKLTPQLEDATIDFRGAFVALAGVYTPGAIAVDVYTSFPNLDYSDNFKDYYQHNADEIEAPYAVFASLPVANYKETAQVIGTYPLQDYDGYTIPAYKEDLYNKILLLPSYIGIGNLLSTITRDVELWSTFLTETRTCESLIAADTEGITITEGEAAVPFDLEPMQSIVYEFTIGMDGPPNIDAQYNWEFDDGSVAILNITGSRVVIFTIPPDAEVEEIMGWLTNIIEVYNGNEQRMNVRALPRQTFNYTITLHDEREQRFTKILLAGWQQRTFALPYWHEARQRLSGVNVGQTSFTMPDLMAQYTEDGMIYIHETPFKNEAAEIDAIDESSNTITLKKEVQNDYNPGAFLMPLRSAFLTAPYQHADHKGRSIYELEWRVREDVDTYIEPKILHPEYKGKEVFIYPNYVESEGVDREVDLQSTIIDYKTGITTKADRFDFPKTHTEQFSFDLNSIEEAWNFRRWMYELRGKQKSFWLPTFKEDLKLTRDFTTGQDTYDIEWVGYSRYLFGSQNHRYVMLMNKYFGAGVNFIGSYSSDIDYDIGDAIQYGDEIYVKYESGSNNPGGSLGDSPWALAAVFREIIDAGETQETDDEETITFDKTLGDISGLNGFDGVKEEVKISFMTTARLNADRIEIVWYSVDRAKVVLPLRNVFPEGEDIS